MDYESISKKIRSQADDLLQQRGLGAILDRYGRYYITGSYYLDVMVYSDLDITILMNGDPLSHETFMKIAGEVADLDHVWRLNYCNHVRYPSPLLPKGLYLGIKTTIESTTRMWKVDLWAMDESLYTEKQQDIVEIKRRMDPESRNLILRIKHSLLTPEGRTPMNSGYHIYRAVLFENLTERDQIIDYLRYTGIELPDNV